MPRQLQIEKALRSFSLMAQLLATPKIEWAADKFRFHFWPGAATLRLIDFGSKDACHRSKSDVSLVVFWMVAEK